MKMSRGISVLMAARNQFGITARTKVGALAELEELYETETGRKFGS